MADQVAISPAQAQPRSYSVSEVAKAFRECLGAIVERKEALRTIAIGKLLDETVFQSVPNLTYDMRLKTIKEAVPQKVALLEEKKTEISPLAQQIFAKEEVAAAHLADEYTAYLLATEFKGVPATEAVSFAKERMILIKELLRRGGTNPVYVDLRAAVEAEAAKPKGAAPTYLKIPRKVDAAGKKWHIVEVRKRPLDIMIGIVAKRDALISQNDFDATPFPKHLTAYASYVQGMLPRTQVACETASILLTKNLSDAAKTGVITVAQCREAVINTKIAIQEAYGLPSDLDKENKGTDEVKAFYRTSLALLANGDSEKTVSYDLVHSFKALSPEAKADLKKLLPIYGDFTVRDIVKTLERNIDQQSGRKPLMSDRQLIRAQTATNDTLNKDFKVEARPGVPQRPAVQGKIAVEEVISEFRLHLLRSSATLEELKASAEGGQAIPNEGVITWERYEYARKTFGDRFRELGYGADTRVQFGAKYPGNPPGIRHEQELQRVSKLLQTP